ncbi:chemotaxis protein MotB [Desulfomicrobium norvegicum]|uniref:Chemotaxis protein MotB n=1 Tax=Desulfomicrobium norvegicum (strain DSM 1741 / NCIMB 8310) TaxID=52561 RepID=A0A8G2F6C3_DESNO|nr:flagellar motor protein MotB [Desulfomicrobium norvegicum]SFL22817.1 chemotaxis protein MotB [Desulfomicrobium norvegicum]
MAEKKAVIIKKVKKGGHGGHHGGAWKIAYADLVTAMMAFFLLMWLLNNVSEEKKEQLSIYFKEFSVIDGLPPSMSMGAGGQSASESQFTPLIMEGTTGMYAEGKSQEEILKEAMAKMIEERLKEYKEELIIDTFDNGVRIQMLYGEGNPFFDSASSQLTGDARNVLKVIADTVRDLPNQVAVEGHTDAVPLGGPQSRYTNWELSTDRASSARVILQEFGVDPKRMVRVAGYAATQPLIRENPEDPRNRRVSILLFNDPTRSPVDVNSTSGQNGQLSVNPLMNGTAVPAVPQGAPPLPSRH